MWLANVLSRHPIDDFRPYMYTGIVRPGNSTLQALLGTNARRMIIILAEGGINNWRFDIGEVGSNNFQARKGPCGK